MNPPPPERDTHGVAAVRPGRYIPALDGLRALAILLVIPHNCDSFPHVARALLPLALLAHAGWIGVQLFFVLSGFLITGNLIDSRRAANYYTAFYGRRVLRIFPLYFTALIVVLLVLPAVVTLPPDVTGTFDHQAWYWTFLCNWSEPFDKGVRVLSHFWSLAVEEQFYLLWPFVIHRLPERRIVTLGVALAVAALAIRIVLVATGSPASMAYMFTTCRMDALALGASAAALVRMPGAVAWLRARSRQLIATCIGIGLVAALSTHGFAVYDWTSLTYGQSMLAACFALLVLYVGMQPGSARGWVLSILSSAPMRSIGRYSFAMYIVHLPLTFWIRPEAFAGLGLWAMGAYVVTIATLSYLAGAASYQLLEKHFLRLKRWFTPRAVPSPAQSTADAATSS